MSPVLVSRHYGYLIERIHGAVVAATGQSDRHGDCRGDRRRDDRQLVARLPIVHMVPTPINRPK